MEEVKVSFYKLTSCGYYPRLAGAQVAFGEAPQTLEQLGMWARGKRLAHTKTFQLREGSNQLPAYFVDVSSDGDTWLLTLWNESANTDGVVTSINGQADVGNAQVAETEVKEGHIPGHATYFWFLPEQNLVASIRFQHPISGVPALNKYLRGFLDRFSSHVVLGEADPDGQREVVGYRSSKEAPLMKLAPRFRTDVFVKPGPLAFIKNHAQLIRKIKKKATLDLAIVPERAMFQKLLESVHLAEHQVVQRSADIQYELEVDGLQPEEVDEIVAQWVQEGLEDTDYGFMLRGGVTTHWLGHEFVRASLTLDVARVNAEIVNPQQLLRELARHRAHLMSLLN